MTKPKRCDACDRKIPSRAHELWVRDAETGQELGCYCFKPGCAEKADKYIQPGVATRTTIVHPPQCLPEYGYCADGLDTSTVVVLIPPEEVA